jgi:hypothetical protein
MFATTASSYSRVSVQSVKLPWDVARAGSRGEYGLPGVPRIRNLRPFSTFLLCIGKADGELLHKLLAFSAYPSTLCIRQRPASSHLCLSLKFFFSSPTTARRSSSSLSSLLFYRYVLLMRMLSFSISLSQLLSRSSRFLSVYIPVHVLVLSCLHISVIQLPGVVLQFC